MASPIQAFEPNDREPYAGYILWKRWDHLFQVSQEQAAYYEGEMRGIAIAGADVLEIGYGSGAFLAWARAAGARATGVEIIPELIEAAASNGFSVLPPNLEDVAANQREAFDTIVALDVFEHFALEVVSTRLATCTAMLRRGGHLILRFPNGQSPFGLAPQAGDPTHRSMLCRNSIEHLMQGTSLTVVRYAPQFRILGGGFKKSMARRLRYLARDAISAVLNAIYAERIPWDAVVVLVLQKS